MKKILSFIMAAMMVVMMLPAVVGAADATKVAAIGDAKYETLAAAVAAANAGDKIDLLGNSTGAGIVINKNLTIDFHGFTYTVGGPAVGSAGTATLGFQIHKNNNVTLANGTIKADDSEIPEGTKPIKMLIQNYANLTVRNMVLDGTGLWEPETGSYVNYVLSNNNGEVVITGATDIKANAGDVAFDVCRIDGYEGAKVTVETTGIIDGAIEVETGLELTINSGRFTVAPDTKYLAENKVFNAQNGKVICKVHNPENSDTEYRDFGHFDVCNDCGTFYNNKPHSFTEYVRDGYKNVAKCDDPDCGYTHTTALTPTQKALDNIKAYMKSMSVRRFAVAIDADETVVITNNTAKTRIFKDYGDSAAYEFLADVKYDFAAAEGYEIVAVYVDGVEVDAENVVIRQIKNNHVIKVVTAAVEAE